jgi:hypothetical protein
MPCDQRKVEHSHFVDLGRLGQLRGRLERLDEFPGPA